MHEITPVKPTIEDLVTAPFPMWDIGDSGSAKEVYLGDIRRDGVKTFPHPDIEGQPLSIHLVGRLIEADIPTKEELDVPDCLSARLTFNLAIMDRDGKAVSNEELHSFNHTALDKINSLVKASREVEEARGNSLTIEIFYWADEDEEILTADIETDTLFFESPVPQATEMMIEAEDAELSGIFYRKVPLIFDENMIPVPFEDIETFIRENEDFFVQAIPYEEREDEEVTIRLLMVAMYAIPA